MWLKKYGVDNITIKSPRMDKWHIFNLYQVQIILPDFVQCLPGKTIRPSSHHFDCHGAPVTVGLGQNAYKGIRLGTRSNDRFIIFQGAPH